MRSLASWRVQEGSSAPFDFAQGYRPRSGLRTSPGLLAGGRRLRRGLRPGDPRLKPGAISRALPICSGVRHETCPFSPGPGPVGFDFDLPGLTCQPMTKAAPRPVSGVFDKAAHDRIAVDVAKLFDELGLGEDAKVVIAALPELLSVALEPLRRSCFKTLRVVARIWALGSERSRWTCSGMST